MMQNLLMLTADMLHTDGKRIVAIKNKINDRERLEMQKYCAHERKHTLHKETR